MEKVYIGVNFANLVSIAIMVGLIVGVFFAVKKFGQDKPKAEAAA